MTTPEEKYPPRKGGMVEQVRAEAAKVMHEEPPAQQDSYPPVNVHTHVPEVVSGQTYVLSTTLNPVLRVLGTDKLRKRAVIMTLDAAVVICNSQASANDNRNPSAGSAGNPAGGFVLPPTSPASGTASPVSLEVKGQGEVWIAATSSTVTRVSVWVESYGDSSA